MEISFKTKLLRDMCERPNIADSKLGHAAARELFARLADIEVADSLEDLHSLGLLSHNGNAHEFFIELTDKCRVLFRPTPGNKDTSDFRLREIDRIKIIEIGEKK